jgi:DNA-binding XRE family transcriptional regulator
MKAIIVSYGEPEVKSSYPSFLLTSITMEGRKLGCTQQVAVLIRHLRRKKEYSQEYMAAHLDISQNAYSKLETGKIPMTIDRLCEVARILDIAPTALLAEIKVS